MPFLKQGTAHLCPGSLLLATAVCSGAVAALAAPVVTNNFSQAKPAVRSIVDKLSEGANDNCEFKSDGSYECCDFSSDGTKLCMTFHSNQTCDMTVGGEKCNACDMCSDGVGYDCNNIVDGFEENGDCRSDTGVSTVGGSSSGSTGGSSNGSSGVTTEAEVEFCARLFANNWHDGSNDGGRNEAEPFDDPIYCRSEPEAFNSPDAFERPYGGCGPVTLSDIPEGYSDEDAAPCLVFDPADTLMCYYNLLTREFCAKFMYDGSGERSFDCSAFEETGGSQVYYWSDCSYPTPQLDCKNWLLLKRGPCDAPAEDPDIPEPQVTDEFLNAKNERVNGQGCPLSDLAPASASDSTRTLVKYEKCYIKSSGREECYDYFEPVLLKGRALQYVYPRDDVDDLYVKGQRRDNDVVCYSWLKTSVGDSVIVNDSTTRECREVCAALGEEVTLVYSDVNKYSVGYSNTAELRVTAYNSERPGRSASSSGVLSSLWAAIFPLIASILFLVFYTVA